MCVGAAGLILCEGGRGRDPENGRVAGRFGLCEMEQTQQEGGAAVQGQLCNRSMMYPSAPSLQRQCWSEW